MCGQDITVSRAPLHLPSGEWVEVTTSAKNHGEKQSTLQKVADVAYLIFSLTIGIIWTVVSTLLGSICTLLSTTYQKTYHTWISPQNLADFSVDIFSSQAEDLKPITPSSLQSSAHTPTLTQHRTPYKKLLHHEMGKWALNPFDTTVDISFALAPRFVNHAICQMMKRRRADLTTPDEVLWPLKDLTINGGRPLPIGPGIPLSLEENIAYALDPHIHPGDPRSLKSGATIKRSANTLFLQLDDSVEEMGIIIDNHYYSPKKDKELGHPLHPLKPGQPVYYHHLGRLYYLFTVGKEGLLLLPDQQQHFPHGMKKHLAQTYAFHIRANQLLKEPTVTYPNRFTKYPQSAETGFEPFKDGFAFSRGSLKDPIGVDDPARKSKLKVDLDESAQNVFINAKTDSVLRFLIHYFQEEFDFMGYTEREKVFRIAQFINALSSSAKESKKHKENFYLGSLLQLGIGVCRHKAALLKVLADHLGIKCSLITAMIDNYSRKKNDDGSFSYKLSKRSDGHVWNVVEIEGQAYILDTAQNVFFPINDPPGCDTASKQRLKHFYQI
jgi:hypothetical protein